MIVFENEPFSIPPADLAALRRVAGGRLERRESGWAIVRLVGHVELPSGLTLRIRSRKTSALSFLTWAAYADPVLSDVQLLRPARDAVSYAGDVGALTAQLFLRETIQAAGRAGLHRTYSRRDVNTPLVRGRINFARLVRQGGQLGKLPCVTWERTANTELNRFLAATLAVIVTDPVLRTASARLLPAARAILEGIQPDVSERMMTGHVALPRAQQAFEPACCLARLLLRHAHIGDGEDGRGASFLINLERMFERTIATALRQAGILAETGKAVRYFRGLGGSPTLDRSGSMAIDVFCPHLPGGPTVIDAKYKSRISSGNLQQMVAYCVLSGARHAVLVVPSGALRETSSFEFPNALAPQNPIRIDTAELCTDATSVVDWRANASKLATAILQLSHARALRERLMHEMPRTDVSKIV